MKPPLVGAPQLNFLLGLILGIDMPKKHSETVLNQRNHDASVYLLSFEVIRDNNLLMFGFIHQLRKQFNLIDKPPFGFNRLKYMVKLHCESPEYLSMSKYGVRYDINNKPVHKLVRVV